MERFIPVEKITPDDRQRLAGEVGSSPALVGIYVDYSAEETRAGAPHGVSEDDIGASSARWRVTLQGLGTE
jgi:hypothetical protein